MKRDVQRRTRSVPERKGAQRDSKPAAQCTAKESMHVCKYIYIYAYIYRKKHIYVYVHISRESKCAAQCIAKKFFACVHMYMYMYVCIP